MPLPATGMLGAPPHSSAAVLRWWSLRDIALETDVPSQRGPFVTETVKKRTVCFTCGQQCGHIAFIQGSKVIRLGGDRDHPRTAGFICPKGVQAPQLHYSPDRLHQPLKRVGARGAGNWETISWEQGIDEVGQKILDLAGTHGAETIAHSFGTMRGSDHAIGKRFMNLLGSPNTMGQDKICLGPIAMGEYLTYGFGPTVGARPVAGLTECVVLWGKRPMQSGRPGWQAIESALKAGTMLLVIDPAKTEEAARADLWLRPRPGTDAALGLGLLHMIISRGRYNADYVAAETIGFDDLRERAALFPPERVADITGVPAPDIVAAAEMMTGDGATIFGGGNGLCQTGSTAVQQGRILACLIVLTGNLNRTGGHRLIGPPRDILANGDWSAFVKLTADQRSRMLGAERFRGIGDFASLDDVVSDAWYGKRGVADWLSSAHEPSLWDAILDAQPYQVRALVIQAHNPLGGSANSGKVLNALLSEKLELLVSHDLFLNATSSLADYVFPAAHWLEKPYFSLGGGGNGYVGDYVEANSPVIEPEFEHRSDYDFFRCLGWRCGQQEYWPERATDFYEQMLEPTGMSFDEVAEHLGPLTGAHARHPESPTSTEQGQKKYGTVSGKIELRSVMLEQWGQDPLPNFELPALFAHAAAYPLTLTTGGRQIEGFHQVSQQTVAFRRKNPEPFASIHPRLAEKFGIEDGEWIAIETPVGSIRQVARVIDTFAADVIHADRWWYPEGAPDGAKHFGVTTTSVNMLTSDIPDDSDPVMGSWLLRGLPCRIAKL